VGGTSTTARNPDAREESHLAVTDEGLNGSPTWPRSMIRLLSNTQVNGMTLVSGTHT